MRPTINYEPHLRLQQQIEEYLVKGGRINPVRKPVVVTNKEFASPLQMDVIHDWCRQKSGRIALLQRRVENRTAMKEKKHWLPNMISGNSRCPMEIYEILLEEMV